MHLVQKMWPQRVLDRLPSLSQQMGHWNVLLSCVDEEPVFGGGSDNDETFDLGDGFRAALEDDEAFAVV